MPDQEALLNSIKNDVEQKNQKYPIRVSEIICILKKAVDILKPEASTGQCRQKRKHKIENTQNSASKISRFMDDEGYFTDDETISDDESTLYNVQDQQKVKRYYFINIYKQFQFLIFQKNSANILQEYPETSQFNSDDNAPAPVSLLSAPNNSNVAQVHFANDKLKINAKITCQCCRQASNLIIPIRVNDVLSELINNGIVSNQVSQPLAQYNLDQQSSLQTNPPPFQSNGNFQNNFSDQEPVNNLPVNDNQMNINAISDIYSQNIFVNHNQSSSPLIGFINQQQQIQMPSNNDLSNTTMIDQQFLMLNEMYDDIDGLNDIFPFLNAPSPVDTTSQSY